MHIISLLFSISFLLGSFVGIGRTARLYRFSRDKLQGWGKQYILRLIIILAFPIIIINFMFSLKMNIFYNIVVTISCFSFGYIWNEIISSVITETEKRFNPLMKLEKPKEDSDSFFKELVNPFMNIYRNIKILFNSKQYMINKFDCKLYTKNDKFKEKFDNLCYEAGLTNVDLLMYESRVQSGFAMQKSIFKKGNHCVCLSSYWCNRLKPKEVTALMAHELMHIKNNDGGIIAQFRPSIAIGVLMIGIFGFAYITDLSIKYIPILGLILLVTLILLFIPFLAIFFYLLFDKHGFWRQLREIKADRMCCELKGVYKEELVGLLTKLKVNYEDDFSKNTWYEKILIRYKENQSHPNFDYRIRLIEKYTEWSLRDYFKLMFSTMKWALTGKGWSGQ